MASQMKIKKFQQKTNNNKKNHQVLRGPWIKYPLVKNNNNKSNSTNCK